MSNPHLKLTKPVVEKADPAEKDYLIWDTDIKGFGLRVWPSGSKTFIYQYRNAKGQTRKLKLGTYPEISHLAARKAAERARGDVLNKIDPQAEKQAEREDWNSRKSIPSLREAIETYIHTRQLKPKTLTEYEGFAERHINPRLGRFRIDEITEEDIARFVLKLSKTRKTTARRCLELITAVYNSKPIKKLVHENPAADVQKPRLKKRKVYLDPDEIHSLIEQLNIIYEKGDRVRCNAVDVLLLQMLTGARRDEIRLLKYRDVDLNSDKIVLHDHKTSTQVDDDDYEREILLTEPVTEIFKRARARNYKNFGPVADDYIFASTNASGAVSTQYHSKVWRAALDAARAAGGIKKDDVRPHDLRHSYASLGLNRGLTLGEVGELLGHRDERTTQRYAHIYDDVKKAGAAKVLSSILKK